MPRGPRWWRATAAAFAKLGLVRAAVALGITVAVVSEALGAFDAFSRGPVRVAWTAVALVAGAGLLRAIRRADADLPSSSAPRAAAPQPASPRDPIVVLSLAIIGVVFTTCLIAALLSPPNVGDVLTYHLPRVRHWIQNHSFAHFPTHNLREISFPPGAGYFVAHLQLLSGSDRFASLPQWLAFVGCAVLSASLACRLFGRGSAVPAAVACATIPMAVLQAAQPQSDLMASFWLLCFVCLVFERTRYRISDVLWSGGALGLGLVTKPTVLLFATPFVLVMAVRAARSGWRTGAAVSIAVVLVAALPSLPHSVRNDRVFGSLRGPSLGITMDRPGLRATASNVLRNVALSCPSVGFWEGIAWLHAHVLHLDPNDPTTTHPRVHARASFEPRFANEYLVPDENTVANPLHVSVAVLAGLGALAIVRRRHGWATRRVQLSVALLLAFGLFSAAIRWQPWANRLLLPLVILGAPFVGWTLARTSPFARATLTGLLGSIAIFFSLASIRRPFIAHPQTPSLTILGRPRGDLYFADDELANGRDALSARYDTLLRQVEADGCADIGLVSQEFDPEYLLWVTLDRSGKPFRVRHLNVANPSRLTAPGPSSFVPCGRVEIIERRWPLYTSQ